MPNQEVPDKQFVSAAKRLLRAPEARLLRVPEASVRLSLRESTVRRMILERRIDVVRIGKAVRIPESCVEAIIARGYSPAVE
jgi:excisionase family DNA binding protein